MNWQGHKASKQALGGVMLFGGTAFALGQLLVQRPTHNLDLIFLLMNIAPTILSTFLFSQKYHLVGYGLSWIFLYLTKEAGSSLLTQGLSMAIPGLCLLAFSRPDNPDVVVNDPGS
jgi:hypothetical protein